MRRVLRAGAVAGMAAWLAGCSVVEQSRLAAGRAQQVSRELVQAQVDFAARMSDVELRRRAQEVDRPWLAGRAQPLAREVTLPAALRADVQTAMMFPESRLRLPTLAERITLATGIPVRVQPDALLPLERFLPRLGGQPGTTSDLEAPADVALPVGAQPLPRILDLVAARLGVSWRYRDGSLEFFRTDTRVFNVRALLMGSSAEASLGRGSQGAPGAFEATSSTRIESTVGDALGAVTSRLEPMLTQSGTVAAHGDGSTLVVITDTPQALARVGEFLERENRALTRRVRLVFEEVTVALREDGEAGIDWNLVYAAANGAASFAAPASAAAQAAGVVTAAPGAARWSGSSAIVRALSEVGSVTRHTSVPLVTLNRRPVTHAVRTTFSWIDRVQTTAMSTVDAGGTTAALPSVSISQKEETVGQFLTVVPDAQEDGQVLVAVAYDNTVAQPLNSITFGRGDNAVQIQQLTVDGSGSVQQVELRPGQPMIVSGFDRTAEQADARRLDARAPLLFGGSQRAASTRETTVVILTAFAEEGF